ncbi:hypothetical protein [Corynebacterium dentalis]|uniref:hypothetical protein n=1 Tax=Corynebacterium dentalis TaxID=2014528 RepID=UPI00370D68EC
MPWTDAHGAVCSSRSRLGCAVTGSVDLGHLSSSEQFGLPEPPQNCAVRIDLEWAPGADELIASSSSSDDGPNYGFALDYTYHHPLSELSPDGEGPGNFFIADDYSHAVRVNDCAASPMDDDNPSGLDFKFLRDGDMTDGAEIDFTVMEDGSITIVDSDVKDFVRDSNGDWVAD